jgi:SpoIIAA-like
VIEVLKGFPDYVVAFKCRKFLTKADLETLLIPLVEDKLSRHREVRLYWEVAPRFVGLDPAAHNWQDTKFSFSHFFGKAALVTDVKWVSRAMRFFGFLMPGEWRVFSTAEADEARKWVLKP